MKVLNCMISLMLLCIEIADSVRPPVQFELIPEARRTDDAKEVVTTTDDGGMELDCSFECFLRNWCRAVVIDTVKPTCELYVEQTYIGANNVVADKAAFVYGEIFLQTAFPYITYTPGGFPIGSRLAMKFKGAWSDFRLFFQFYGTNGAMLLMVVIDDTSRSVTRQGINGAENDGGYPFDAENVWQVEMVKTTVNDVAIIVNGTLFTTYNTTAATMSQILISGQVDRFPIEIQFQEAAV